MNKIGRNDPCYCGSGKKYKKCCLAKDEEKTLEEMKGDTAMEEGEEWEAEEEQTRQMVFDDMPEDAKEDEAEFEENEEDSYDAKGENDIRDDTGTDADVPSVRDSPYPAISKEEERIVDEWWELYKEMGNDPDEIHPHLQLFMDKYSPEMVENLGLEHEILFDLGAAYCRAGRHEAYIQLLQDIRVKYPAVYIRSAGYYDADIITWLIANKRNDEIYDYLDYFEKYPVQNVDKMFSVVNLLLATGNIQPLLSLIKKVHAVTLASPEIINAYRIVVPLITDIMSGYLRPDFTEAHLERMIKEISAEFNSSKVENVAFWKTRFDRIFRPFTLWDESIPLKKSQMEERYLAVSFNYMRYLHEYKNISWISANYYSHLMQQYLLEYAELCKRRPKKLFNFTEKMIDTIVGRLSASFIFSDFIKAASMLNSIWYFQEYLHVCGNIDESKKNEIQLRCAGLYNTIYLKHRKENIETLCFPKLPFWE